VAERKRLTDKLIGRFDAPKRGRRTIVDDLLPALALRITNRGKKTWSVTYKVAGQGGVSVSGRVLTGKAHRFTLGGCPTLGVADARKRAREVLAKALDGRDARHDRRDAFAQKDNAAIDRVAELFTA
jgi:hypothetical protein